MNISCGGVERHTLEALVKTGDCDHDHNGCRGNLAPSVTERAGSIRPATFNAAMPQEEKMPNENEQYCRYCRGNFPFHSGCCASCGRPQDGLRKMYETLAAKTIVSKEDQLLARIAILEQRVAELEKTKVGRVESEILEGLTELSSELNASKKYDVQYNATGEKSLVNSPANSGESFPKFGE